MRHSTQSNWERFWKSKTNVDDVYSNADRILRNLKSVTDLKGKYVLEVGAGTGRDSFGLVKLGAVVYQLDYAENSLTIIRAFADQEGIRVHLTRGDAFALPFPDLTFDVVFHQGLLEHFREEDANALLRENVRVLQHGGYLLVDVPQRYHVYTLVKHILIFFGQWFAGWEREFSFVELAQVLKGHRLTVVHSYGEWMYPSLFYRTLREVLRKVGIKIPLRPQLSGVLTRVRSVAREKARRSRLALYLSQSIGIIGQKR